MTFSIANIGTAVPPNCIPQAEATALASGLCCATKHQERVLARLYQSTGVKHRHSVLLDAGTDEAPVQQEFFSPARGTLDRGPTTAQRMRAYEDYAGDLATLAAQHALTGCDVAAGDITHLITVSCSGFAAPGVDVHLIRALNLQPSVARWHVGFMGCHGAMNGLRLADEICRASDQAKVLLVATELCSLHQQYGWHPERLVSNALFADGAAAVIGPANAKLATEPWSFRAAGSYIIPDTEHLMSWRIGDHGFEMYLSPQVPHMIQTVVSAWLMNWLGRQQLKVSDIGSWAIHPGGPRILDACVDGLGLNGDAVQESLSILSELGNMSSPTILFVIDRLRARASPLPCVTLGFGPGLAVEAILWDVPAKVSRSTRAQGFAEISGSVNA